MVSAIKGASAVLIEVNCETDFAAKEPEFLKTLRSVSEVLLNTSAKASTTEEILCMFH